MLIKKIMLGIGLVGLSTSVSAHVSISDVSSNTAGSRSEVTFTIPHGCGEKSTIAIVTTIPEEVMENGVRAKADAVWKNRVVDEENNTVSWSGGSLSNHDYTKVSIRIRWPELAEGEGSRVFEFPLSQICSGGESRDWHPSTTVIE